MSAFTDTDYERVVRERDEALARVDSQRSQIAFYRTACTARFLPEGFGDDAMRELIKELTEDLDEALATIAQIRRVFGNALAFDDARGDIVKMAEIAYRGACDGDKAVGELRGMTRQRDEWRDKFHALNQTAGELCNACGWAFKIPGESCRCEVVKERDEARAEATNRLDELNMARAYRRGAEAMREACAAALMADGLVLSRERAANVVRALPIPEET